MTIRRARIVLAAVALCLGLCSISSAATISFEVSANVDTDGDARWEDLTSGNPSGSEFLLDTAGADAVTRVASGSSYVGITHAYEFVGGATGNVAGAELIETDPATAKRSFQNSSDGDWTSGGQDVSIEIWFKPDNLAPTPANGQILFEDGGGTGIGFFVDDNLIRFRRATGAGQVNANISALAGEFIQVVGTWEYDTSGTMKLYVNGSEAGTPATGVTGNDWSGGDNAGLGTLGGDNVGGIGSGQSNTESFDGKIALFRVYRDQILTSEEIFASYDAMDGHIQKSGWTDVKTALATASDYFGTVVTVGSGENGTNASGAFSGDGQHTNADGDDTVGWAVGDYVLEGNFTAAQEPAIDTVLAVITLEIPSGQRDIDLTLTFTQDMEGTLEADDSLRFEIYDVVGDTVLSSLTLAGQGSGGFSVDDTPETLTSLDNVGLTTVQARLIYSGGGWSDGDQEEVQIGDPVFAATYVPEPATMGLLVLGGGVLLARRRRRA